MSVPPPANPFTQRGTIREPEQFFGRQAELQQMFDLLRKMQSVSVVGERRIGKSSLLVHIAQTGGQRLGPDVQVCYTDLPSLTDEASFYGRVCQELGREGNSFQALEGALKGRRVVVCLDEFEQVAGRPAIFERGFFDTLRSLANSGSLALVVATQHSLADLARTERIATSPFWNIFTRVDLGLFTPREAEDVLTSRFAAANVTLAAEDVSRVLQLSGRFPLFFELACYHLFESRARQAGDWQAAFAADPDVFAHLRYLWEHRPPPEQSALRWAVGLKGGAPDDRLLLDMERRGLLVRESKEPSGYWPFSEAFADIVRKPPTRPRKQKWLTLANLRGWLQTLKEVKDVLPGGKGKDDKD